ncbi:HAD-IC family P-type ATPase [Roseibium polysiphoniae]|uniref:HAD-IC family P-type ATPase n=1 Tax=Roseibium polysiphoniae TaxID=2571221 RepID=UPI003297516B
MSTDAPWHSLPVDDALKHFHSRQSGLSPEEAARALQEYGPNTLPSAKPRSLLRRFLHQFNSVLIYVLLGCAGITLMLGHLTDSLVILAAVFANALIGIVQEGRAENAMASISKILSPQATVLRDARRLSTEGRNVVPGDIVVLEAGERVPADLRLLRANSLFIQEAILTGESVAVEKQTSPVPKDVAIAERSCMAYSGTMVTMGEGLGVVIATGTQSEIGRIGGLLSDIEELQTPLLLKMGIFARWLTALILILGALLFAYGYAVLHQNPQLLFMSIVGLSVAAIPEGLPAVLTITLAIGVQAMAKRNAIVRRLPSIETLGSVSVICTDKTGTLTFNEMSVTNICLTTGDFRVEGEGYEPSGRILRSDDASALEATSADLHLSRLARAAELCNDAMLHQEGGHWKVEGDPMEGALLAMSRKISPRKEAPRDRVALLPFDASYRYMATLTRTGPQSGGPTEQTLITIKGAPERILAMCTQELGLDGMPELLNERQWHQRAEALANAGQRVLALAEKHGSLSQTSLSSTDLVQGLVLIGLVGLMDPPRPEAIEAVADCRSAGIQVKMVTGDHAGTAAAIGRQIGLEKPGNILTGADIDVMTDAELRACAMETDVFARTSPEHKLRLVAALQTLGMTVAMTGDGVNDAPALKRADAGIAMGQKGSEAAREAADLVLADDNFRSIADAVREGRTVYDNIVKVIGWTLPTSTGEAMIVAAAILFGLTLPITAAQILWINLITASTLGMALAFEPSESGTMSRPPRKRSQPLLTGELVWHIALVSALFMAAVFGMFVYIQDQGHSVEYARTITVNTIVFLEIFQLLFVRTMHVSRFSLSAWLGTRPVWIAIVLVVLGQLAMTYLPALQLVFETRPLEARDMALIIALGVVLYVILEIEKRMRMALTDAPAEDKV